MYYAHGVQIVDCVQNLPNEPTGIHLCVEALFYNAVKQLASRHPVSPRTKQQRERLHKTVFAVLYKKQA